MSESFKSDLPQGLSVDASGRVIWEESFGYDPDSEWCRSVDARIAVIDEAFLKSCGVKKIDSNE